MTNKELIWGAALRYALGRRTYMPSVVCAWFREHQLSNLLIASAIEDIERQEKFSNLGDDCDKREWLRLKEYLQNKLKEGSLNE